MMVASIADIVSRDDDDFVNAHVMGIAGGERRVLRGRDQAGVHGPRRPAPTAAHWEDVAW